LGENAQWRKMAKKFDRLTAILFYIRISLLFGILTGRQTIAWKRKKKTVFNGISMAAVRRFFAI